MATDPTVQGSPTVLPVRVVLLDNRPERRQLIRRVVETGHAGAVVVGEAETATEAIDLVGREQADVVVVEIQLPVDLGLQAIADLRAAYPSVGVIVCSFHVHPDTQQRARDRGTDVYVAKPVTPRQLGETLAGLASVPRHWATSDPSPAL
jgi:DNA-binding NarL/FixJ family response regulator